MVFITICIEVNAYLTIKGILLKKAGVFNELRAKQLRAWADVRNNAAHGEFDQFQRADVEQMIQGISNFLADYLA